MQPLIIIGVTACIFGLGLLFRKIIYSPEELNQEIKREYHESAHKVQ